MTEEQIKSGNKAIAEFMGYVYFESGIHTDIGDCYKDFQDVDVYSKVPIEVNDYPEDKQKYFKDLPNPDFGNINSNRWRSDLKTLGWDTLNSGNYKMKLTYDLDWNELMPVIEKIGDVRIRQNQWFTVEITNGYTRIHGTGEKIMYNASVEKSMIKATWLAVIKFIEWYGENKNEKK